MEHNEFLRAVSETRWIDATRLARLARYEALIPASWCRDILRELPEAEGYLRERCPEAMREVDAAQAASGLSMAQMRRIVAADLGRRSTPKKAAAARANGKKGGRPRKHPPADSR